MKTTILRAPALLAAVLAAAVAGYLGTSAAADGSRFRVTRTVVMKGLNHPWDLAFAPDGSLFFTEKCRGLSVRAADGSVHFLFGNPGAALEASDFFCQGQSGMLGVAVDPAFAENRFVYVYMTSDPGSAPSNRVVRLTVDKTCTRAGNRTDIVADIPFKRNLNRWGAAGAHSGGRIRFSPFDGLLYVATGDNHKGSLPQDLSRLGGKILRIDRDGKAAPGNNTPSGGDPRIFTYGHRNVQGIAFRPGTGLAFACEHGPDHDDEVTQLAPGGNAGWDPSPQQGVKCASDYCGYTSNRPDGTPTSMTDVGRFPGALRPAWSNRGASEGMGPCVFLSGPHWRQWQGRLAVGFLRGSRIDLLQLDSGGTVVRAETAPDLPSQRMRALVAGPDGALYAAVDEGEIWRLQLDGT